MAIEELSAGLAGVARLPQRPTKNALISNTDNPAVQQYAQVSRFTSYLTDVPPEPPQNQGSSDRPETPAPTYSSSSSSGSSEGDTAPVLNYGRNGLTTPVQKPTVAGQFLSVVA